MSSASASRRRSHRRRTVPLAALAAAFGVLALSACTGTGTSGGSSSTRFVTGIGGIDTVEAADRQTAPDLTGETLDGKKLSISDYKGKVVVINVWGSWCSPCRAEAKYLAEVAEQTQSKGVQFVGINTRDDEQSAGLQFEKDFGVTYPSLFDPIGKQLLRFPKGSLNLQAIPSTIVIDRQGRIAARALLALDDTKLHRMIDPLIAEK
jgi:thiol-disulfide isomerase/thioredoxin